MDIIGSGAEAIIYKKGDLLVKERLPKAYRIPIIDDKLRKSRTKREHKILSKLFLKDLPVPNVSNLTKYSFELDFIEGTKVRDCLNSNIDLISSEIGLFLAKMHDLDIVHGDLTTSNMIFNVNKVYFIDFGLSKHSLRIEDKAVDLHLLKQALESYHYDCWEESFNIIINTYKGNSKTSEDVLVRFDLVEMRGRNKH